jgi:uncharacterized protein DUF5683
MKIFYLLIFLFFLSSAYSQVTPTDSAASKKAKVDTTKQKTWDPKVAARRSAIIPGWGQAYNKKYWKIPIVYTGLGISGYVFVNNIKIYKEYKFAYSARIKAQETPPDSTDYHQLDPIYKVLSPNSIRSARDEFRRYVDYSALVFLLLWGLNVVDAAVDAHLKNFDVSPDLSLQIRPGYSDMAQTSGVSLVLKIGK